MDVYTLAASLSPATAYDLILGDFSFRVKNFAEPICLVKP